jgi:hypothetical protein
MAPEDSSPIILPAYCADGVPAFVQEVSHYYACIENAAKEMEQSAAPAETVAKGALSACDGIGGYVHVQAGVCDAQGKSTNLAASYADLEAKAENDAIRVVLKIRAARNQGQH